MVHSRKLAIYGRAPPRLSHAFTLCQARQTKQNVQTIHDLLLDILQNIPNGIQQNIEHTIAELSVPAANQTKSILCLARKIIFYYVTNYILLLQKTRK